MLTLTAEQVDVFRAQALERFYTRAEAHLRACFPDIVGEQPTADLRPQIAAAVARAREAGVRQEKDVLLVVDASFLLERHPEHDAFVASTLNRAGTSPSARADALFRRAVSHRYGT